MWKLLIAVSCCVTATSACIGCHFATESFQLTSCLPGSENYIDIKCASPPQMTEDCKIISNCSRDFPQPIKSMKGRINCNFNGFIVEREFDNVCNVSEILREYPQLHTSALLRQYAREISLHCPEKPVKSGFQAVEFDFHHVHRRLIPMMILLQGAMECRLEFFDINGDELGKVCYLIKNEMNCEDYSSRMRRKVKTLIYYGN